MGRFVTRREESTPFGDDLTVRKATERAELMATSELVTWCESISSTIAVQVGSYAAHRTDDTQLHEARRQIEVLHGLLTVLINRT